METPAQFRRRWGRGLLIIAGIYGIGFAGALGWSFYKVHTHSKWYHHVEYLILRLAPHRPADVTPEQWSCCLHWTWNLHANHGAMSYFPEDQRDAFTADFERHLDGPTGLDTIDAIWDDYGRYAPRALGYMQYRPTKPPMLPDAAGQARYQGYEPLDWWIKELEKREREMK